MSKYIYVFLLIGMGFFYAQTPSENRFTERESTTINEEASSSVKAENKGVSRRPGNPGNPAPINDYIPFLLAVGCGIMVYVYRKRKYN